MILEVVMPSVNRTQFALLGMLAYGPMSGYDIKKRIDASVAFFWNENYGRIYPVLAQLEKKGFIKRVLQVPKKNVKRQAGRPERKVFQITPGGKEELVRWLQVQPEKSYYRVEVLLKLFFGPFAQPEYSIKAVELERERASEAYKSLQEIEKQFLSCGKHEEADYGHLTLKYGLDFYGMVMKWCDTTIAHLKQKRINRR